MKKTTFLWIIIALIALMVFVGSAFAADSTIKTAEGGGIKALLLGKVMDWGGFAIVLMLVGWLAKTFLLPWLEKNQLAMMVAKYLDRIADGVIADFRSKFPDKELLKYIDQIEDKIAEACGLRVNREALHRVTMNALEKRGFFVGDNILETKTKFTA